MFISKRIDKKHCEFASPSDCGEPQNQSAPSGDNSHGWHSHATFPVAPPTYRYDEGRFVADSDPRNTPLPYEYAAKEVNTTAPVQTWYPGYHAHNGIDWNPYYHEVPVANRDIHGGLPTRIQNGFYQRPLDLDPADNTYPSDSIEYARASSLVHHSLAPNYMEARCRSTPMSYLAQRDDDHSASVKSPSSLDSNQRQLSSAGLDFFQNHMELMSFPHRLMQTLIDHPNPEAIDWLPDGKSFAIIDQDLFIAKVFSKGFPKVKYSSFVRKLHRWGFVRLASGTGTNCFHHPLFTKHAPESAALITCSSLHGTTPTSKPSLEGFEQLLQPKRRATKRHPSRASVAPSSKRRGTMKAYSPTAKTTDP